MKLHMIVAIVVASILSSASSGLARDTQTECDDQNFAMLANGLDQACVESATDNTKNDVFCQQSCSNELIAAFEGRCSRCVYREAAAKRCYRLNSTYSCQQLNDDSFFGIDILELKAIRNCFGQNISTTDCNITLRSLVSIMGCCFNVVYNTSLYEKDQQDLATFELWQTYDLAPLEDCLIPPFDLLCSITNDITSSTNGERGLRQTLVESIVMLLLATLLVRFH